jgi:hypothetical protein
MHMPWWGIPVSSSFSSYPLENLSTIQSSGSPQSHYVRAIPRKVFTFVAPIVSSDSLLLIVSTLRQCLGIQFPMFCWLTFEPESIMVVRYRRRPTNTPLSTARLGTGRNSEHTGRAGLGEIGLRTANAVDRMEPTTVRGAIKRKRSQPASCRAALGKFEDTQR